MGTYNDCTLRLSCPRCGQRAEVDVDLYPGVPGQMHTVQIGDAYPWELSEGYAECRRCRRDFFCTATVVDGVLAEIAPDPSRFPHQHDTVEVGVLACAACGSTQTRLRRFDGIPGAQLLCDEANDPPCAEARID